MDAELNTLLAALGAIKNFEQRYGKVIRDAMDYVIDGERMGRTRLAEAEKAEKTIFGDKSRSVFALQVSLAKRKNTRFLLG